MEEKEAQKEKAERIAQALLNYVDVYSSLDGAYDIDGFHEGAVQIVEDLLD